LAYTLEGAFRKTLVNIITINSFLTIGLFIDLFYFIKSSIKTPSVLAIFELSRFEYKPFGCST